MIKLATNDTCTGCAACMNACPHDAIYMQEDKEGFNFPEINFKKCIECGLCKKICPILTIGTNIKTNDPEAFAFWNIQDRKKSSSGGAFSAIARWVLENKGIVFGATFDKSINVKHIGIKEMEDLALLRGSKYIQSNINNSFREAKDELKKGRYVLFTGTPCQIAGLKSYVGARLAEKLILIDIVCHGVPSQKIFSSYIYKIEKKIHTKVLSFNFRKLNGWGYVSSITTPKKKKKLYGVENIYMYAFERGDLFRKSCYICPYANIPRQGDLTIADFWGIGRHGAKFKKSTMAGVSLILVNTSRGKEILEKAVSIIPHYLEKRKIEEAIIENRNLVNPSILYQNRNEIIAAFLNPEISLKEINIKYSLVPYGMTYIIKNYALRLGIINYVKECYSILKRL